MKQTLETIDEDIVFLKVIDKKLHYLQFVSSPVYGEGYVDNYTPKKMNKTELSKILKIVDSSNEIILYPINTSMGFSVGFSLDRVSTLAPGIPPERETLLRFREDQLPSGYAFDYLSSYFMKPSNLSLAKIVGENIVNERSRYDY